MKAYEIPLKLNKNGQLNIPEKILRILEKEKSVRAIFLLNEDDDVEESSWALLTEDQFLKGYSKSDEIYDRI